MSPQTNTSIPWAREHAFSTIALAAVAGFVNVAGMLALGTASSSVTGSVSHVALWSSAGLWPAAIRITLLAGSFLTGAFTSSVIVEVVHLTQWRSRGRYALPFIIETGLLAGIGTWGLFHEHLHPWLAALGLHPFQITHTSQPPASFSYLLAFAMGIQNALVTRSGQSVVRTTHLTGVITDIGHEAAGILSSIVQWLAARARGEAQHTLPRILNLSPFLIHWGIVLGFGCAGCIGALTFRAAGYAAFFIPSIGLVLLGFTPTVHTTLDLQDRMWTSVTHGGARTDPRKVQWRRIASSSNDDTSTAHPGDGDDPSASP